MDYKVKIVGIPIRQNQQEFVLGKFTISQFLKFTKYTKRLIVGYDEKNLPIYNQQIQREVENSRVEKIANFLIYDPEATFPTNIVLHIPTQVIDYQKLVEDQESGFKFLEIGLKDIVYEGVKKEAKEESSGDIYISIIDGQHRIRGIEIAIEKLTGLISEIVKVLEKSPNSKTTQEQHDKFSKRLKDLLDIELVASFFIDKSLEYQAMIFSTINRTQKRVSESLVYSLFGLTSEDSPQKTALQIVLALNTIKRSPFENRIKLYGGNYQSGESPPLSQATMVKSIVDNICENSKESELDRYRKRKELFKRSASSEKRLIFRKYYAENNDSKISDIFYYFFTAVQRTFVNADGVSFWDFNPKSNKPQNILHTTAGYFSLIQILGDILDEVGENDRFETETYMRYLKIASGLKFNDQKRYPFTTKSRSVFYYDMSLKIWPPKNNDDKRLVRLAELLDHN